MRHTHFVIIRFSVYIGYGFQNREANKLFTDERLKQRFFYFENLCLPSIRRQVNQDFQLVLLIDKNLPAKWKKRLVEITNDMNNVILHTKHENDILGSANWLQQYVDDDVNAIVYTRLDDDDALNCQFIQQLKGYITPDNLDAVVSHNEGLCVLHHQDKYLVKKEAGRCLSTGLTLIASPDNRSNIYEFVHNKLIETGAKKVIVDRTPNMFVVLNHPFNDSNRYTRSTKQQFLKKFRESSLEYVHRMMGIVGTTE